MTSPDSVSVQPDQVAAGVAAFDSAAARLAATVQQIGSGVLGLSNAGTWGGDAAGTEFAGSYLQGGGPGTTLFGATAVGGLVAALTDVGPAVTEIVAVLLDTDRQNAAGMPPTDGGAAAPPPADVL